jgi:K+ potassium transporter
VAASFPEESEFPPTDAIQGPIDLLTQDPTFRVDALHPDELRSPDQFSVLGIASLIIWCLLLLVTVKYMFVVATLWRRYALRRRDDCTRDLRAERDGRP